jgi:hypothetical protein
MDSIINCSYWKEDWLWIWTITHEFIKPYDFPDLNKECFLWRRFGSLFYINTGKKRIRLSILKKLDKLELRQDDMNFSFLCQRSYNFQSNWSYIIYFPISIQEFLCVSTSPPYPEKWTNFFLRNTYKIHDYKKRNGNPTEFVICYPLV